LDNAVAKVIKYQRSWADKLGEKEQQLPIKQKKYFLLAFTICMSAVSFSFLYRALWGHAGMKSYLKNETITPPPNTALPDSLDIKMLEEMKREKMAAPSATDSVKH
jgi:hypothetical protein